MDKGLPGPAQLPVYMMCSDKQVETWLQIHRILASLTQTLGLALGLALGPALSTALSRMTHEKVKPAEHLPRMDGAGLALRGRSPRVTSR